MPEINFNNIFDVAIGGTHGISEAEFTGAIFDHKDICRQVQDERQNGAHAFLDLPYQNIGAITGWAKKHAKSYENFVVLGIGGSALGTLTLNQALNPPFYNLLPAKARKGFPRLFVLDNIDPAETQALFKLLNPKKTLFNVISKSGETTETIASLMLALNLLKKNLGKNWARNLVVTTDQEKGFLRRWAAKENMASFETPKGVEGRFSVLSTVGLLPAACVGINIKKLLAGAAKVDKLIQQSQPEQNPAFLMALVNYLFDTKKGKNTLVLMPYSAQLKAFSEWVRQIVPESLGKRFDNSNNEVFVGPTVLNVLGVTDQHSQIQLFNEGPNNKLIVFVETATTKSNVRIANILKDESGASFLAGHTLQELMLAEKKATEYALVKSQRPNYTIKLRAINEESLGGLFYLWELATAYGGKIYNINPYNQPGVEAGKRATFALMGRKGFEQELTGLSDTLLTNPRWLVKT